MIVVVQIKVPGCEAGIFLDRLCETLHKDGRSGRRTGRFLRTIGTEFTPIFLFILVAIMIALGMLTASAILGPRRQTPVKQMPYESGMDPIGDARQRFDVRYYLVAIVFLLFDVELLFLYPWAVAQWSVPSLAPAPASVVATAPMAPAPALDVSPGVVIAGIPPVYRNLVFGEILVFIAILAAAFAYAWRKGVFEWR
jgi:NADH-quinone oxidoreductase subunit A